MTAALETPVTAAAVAIEAHELSHRYGRRTALEPLSFALAAPGVAAVTGPNGSGKSTLLRVLSGLLRPSQGSSTMTVGGRAMAPADRRRWVGFASPDVAFYEELSAIENLVFTAETRGGPAPAEAAAAALARVGLGSRANDRVSALSSGMTQRLRLAFAVLHRPPVLLLDEPGSHLDDEGRGMLAGLIDRERRTGLVLIATNDEKEWRLAEQRIELRGRGLGHPA